MKAKAVSTAASFSVSTKPRSVESASFKGESAGTSTERENRSERTEAEARAVASGVFLFVFLSENLSEFRKAGFFYLKTVPPLSEFRKVTLTPSPKGEGDPLDIYHSILV